MTTTDKSRRALTLPQAAREFVRHPSPPMILALLVVASAMRIARGDWQLTDAVVPVVMLAAFPFLEWVIHVAILHWRPRRVGPVVIDPLLARKHREHHVDPRQVELIFIPWQALLWVLPAVVLLAAFAFPRLELGLTFLMVLGVLGLAYEWTHYLIHSDYKPKSSAYRAIWRNHRHHHFKNENYWFTVTSAGTADRVLGTCPDPQAVPSSPTAKNLHSLNA
ncbi:sterol desaturase family protein [Mycolicibacterium confluentis]|uniref:Fatty acid hydroxylase n=1 Tax=Mycolicibacterium confluentis TaxID=28047 RepID=A0A7I7XWM2_9MYCO|nr:sterol desaturase family protein [Mycolicibacterium confluentis]MCV7321743.1 sterol desaturase family protein [Mycolicibacterium confluentis]ORV32018.1 fatty acid hydroxylase [Mycolicibacterium confluentis]BBZ33554.1 fatty acid hydroxylase [Mycolicibacterium confluentis]